MPSVLTAREPSPIADSSGSQTSTRPSTTTSAATPTSVAQRARVIVVTRSI